MALGPAEVHPHQHLGEVGGVDAAGLGADGDERLADVVRAGEQGADLELADRLLAALASSVSASASVEASLSSSASSNMHAEVVEAAAQLLDAVDLVLRVRERGR